MAVASPVRTAARVSDGAAADDAAGGDGGGFALLWATRNQADVTARIAGGDFIVGDGPAMIGDAGASAAAGGGDGGPEAALGVAPLQTARVGFSLDRCVYCASAVETVLLALDATSSAAYGAESAVAANASSSTAAGAASSAWSVWSSASFSGGAGGATNGSAADAPPIVSPDLPCDGVFVLHANASDDARGGVNATAYYFWDVALTDGGLYLGGALPPAAPVSHLP